MTEFGDASNFRTRLLFFELIRISSASVRNRWIDRICQCRIHRTSPAARRPRFHEHRGSFFGHTCPRISLGKRRHTQAATWRDVVIFAVGWPGSRPPLTPSAGWQYPDLAVVSSTAPAVAPIGDGIFIAIDISSLARKTCRPKCKHTDHDER